MSPNSLEPRARGGELQPISPEPCNLSPYRRFLIASSISAESSRYVNRISASSPAPRRRASIRSAPAVIAGTQPAPERSDRRRHRRRRRRRLARLPGPTARPGPGRSARAPAMPYDPRSSCSRPTSSREIRCLAAEHARDEADLGEVLDRLHLVVRGEQVRPHRQRAVVGQQHAVVRLDVLSTASGSSRVDGVPYSASGMLPSVVNTSARTARSSGIPRRQSPSPSAGARGRRRPHQAAGGTASRCIWISDDGSRSPWICCPSRSVTTHHVGRHESLAHARGRHEQAVVADSHADVAVVAGGVPARVHATADLDDVGAKGFDAHPACARYFSGRRSNRRRPAAAVVHGDGAIRDDVRAANRSRAICAPLISRLAGGSPTGRR